MSTVNQQGTGGGMEHHGMAGGGRGPPTCWHHLLPIAPTGAVEAETEEAGGEEVVLGAATRHIEPRVVHQGCCMTCQAGRPRGTGGRWCQKLPAAATHRAKGPDVAGEGAISQLTAHQHQGAGPSHSHVGVTGSLRRRDQDAEMERETGGATQKDKDSQTDRNAETQEDGETRQKMR